MPRKSYTWEKLRFYHYNNIALLLNKVTVNF